MSKEIDTYLKEVVEKETKGLWDKAFNEGILTGWLAGCAAMYEQTKDFIMLKRLDNFCVKSVTRREID